MASWDVYPFVSEENQPGKKLSTDELISRCKKADRKAQKQLFELFGPLMKTVCLRYLYNRSLVEEVMVRGFLKVFEKLHQFEGKGSFEGWIRKIMVRECLTENKKHRINYSIDESEEHRFIESAATSEQEHDAAYIMKVVESLPMGYRTVFNLYEIEGYTYEEISSQLQITESACRSQLARAKKLLRKKLKDIQGL